MRQALGAGLALLVCGQIFIFVFATACSGKTIVDPATDAGSGGATASSTSSGTASGSTSGTSTSSGSGCDEEECMGGPSECRCTASCPGGEFSVECHLGSPNHSCECFIDGVSDGVSVLTKDPEPCDIFSGPCASTFFP